MRHDDDICEKCGAEFDENSYLMEPDGYEEYWGAMVSRPEIAVGYICPLCGYRGSL